MTQKHAAAPKPRRRRSLFTGRDKIVITLMVAIPTTLHVLLVWIPTISSIILSFSRWDGFSSVSEIEFAGLRNYREIFTVFEDDFWLAFFNNAFLLLFLFGLATPLGMLLAYLLDKNIRGSRIYQSMYYTPVVMSLAVVGFIWKSIIYSPRSGLASYMVNGFEGPDSPTFSETDWLGNSNLVFNVPFTDSYGLSRNFLAILVAIAWRHVGYVMVLYLAGMKSVDVALRESASIDGCNEWQAFRRVIFPVLKPINVIVAVITVIEALRAFDIVDVLKTPPGTKLLSVLTTDNLVGEGGGNVGRGSAYATILFFLCFGFVVWYITNHFRHEESSQ